MKGKQDEIQRKMNRFLNSMGNPILLKTNLTKNSSSTIKYAIEIHFSKASNTFKQSVL